MGIARQSTWWLRLPDAVRSGSTWIPLRVSLLRLHHRLHLGAGRFRQAEYELCKSYQLLVVPQDRRDVATNARQQHFSSCSHERFSMFVVGFFLFSFLLSYSITQATVVEYYGAPTEIWLQVDGVQGSSQLNLTFTLVNKTTTRLVEAHWVEFNPAGTQLQGWNLDKVPLRKSICVSCFFTFFLAWISCESSWCDG